MYQKNNIFTGAYTIDKSKAFYPKARWVVRKRIGDSFFTADMSEEGSIVLILEDQENDFWSVMSFLNQDDIDNLIDQLTKSKE